MTPQSHRMDMAINPDLKQIVVDRAAAEGKTLNEVVTELLCQALGLELSRYVVPRRSPGRKPGKPSR